MILKDLFQKWLSAGSIRGRWSSLKEHCWLSNPSGTYAITADVFPWLSLAEQLNPCKSIADKIERELNNDPPVQINRGNAIAAGVSEELDELRTILYSGKDYLIELQNRESTKNRNYPP